MKFLLATLGLTASLSLALLASVAPASAQISGAYSYDGAYFITGATTIDGDIRHNDVFVGKDNATNFATLVGPITLTVNGGANGYGGAQISYSGLLYPDGRVYYGLNVFGGNKANINGGKVSDAYSYNASYLNISGGGLSYVTALDTSTVNMSGGSAGFTYGYNASTFNISGGDVLYPSVYDNSTLNISGGSVFRSKSYTSSTVNISGGSVYQAFGYDSTINSMGGSLSYAYGYGASTFNIFGGDITDVLAYDNSVFNLYGGRIGASTIRQLNDAATVNFFGKSLTFSSATATVDNGYAGVSYNVAWTQANGNVVNTRYFDVNGFAGNSVPQGVTFTVQGSAAPEPSAIALLGFALPLVGVAVRRRRVGAK